MGDGPLTRVVRTFSLGPSGHVTEVMNFLSASLHPYPKQTYLTPLFPEAIPFLPFNYFLSLRTELKLLFYQETFFVSHTVCAPKGHACLRWLLIYVCHSLPVLYLKSVRRMPYSFS